MATQESDRRRYMEPPKDSLPTGTDSDSKKNAPHNRLMRRISGLWQREIPVVDKLIGNISAEEQKAREEGRPPRVPFSTGGEIPSILVGPPPSIADRDRVQPPRGKQISRRALLRIGAAGGLGVIAAGGVGALVSRVLGAPDGSTATPGTTGGLASPPTEASRTPTFPPATATLRPTDVPRNTATLPPATATLRPTDVPRNTATLPPATATLRPTDVPLGEKPLTEQEKKEIAEKLIGDFVNNGLSIEIGDPSFGVDNLNRNDAKYALPSKTRGQLEDALKQYGMELPEIPDAALGELAYNILLFGNLCVTKKDYPHVDYRKLNNSTLSDRLKALVEAKGMVEVYSSKSEDDAEPGEDQSFYAGNGYVNTLRSTSTDEALPHILKKEHGANIIPCSDHYAVKLVVEPDPDNHGTNRLHSYTFASKGYIKGVQTQRAQGAGNTQITMLGGGTLIGISKFPEYLNGAERVKTDGRLTENTLDPYVDILIPETNLPANGTDVITFAKTNRTLIHY